jgi:class 3 adenylate cyclase
VLDPDGAVSGTASLFTDIVGSTATAVELGDGGWAELLERHNAVVRGEIVRFGGEEMDTSGDGFFAVFPDSARAIEAAESVRVAVHELGLQIRMGIHVGDCWVADGKCTGLAVHIGARIADLARPDEILVSQAVRDSAGPPRRFADRGDAELKGVPGWWHLYALA